MTNFQDPNQQMHPQDRKNLLIFFAVTIVVFLMYDIFIHRPAMEAKRMAAQEAALAKAQLGPDGITGEGTADAPILDRSNALALAERVVIDTDTIIGSVNLTGARFDDLSLRKIWSLCFHLYAAHYLNIRILVGFQVQEPVLKYLTHKPTGASQTVTA